MGMNQIEVDEGFAALGLSPSPAEVTALTSIGNTVQSFYTAVSDIVSLPEVQTEVVPVVQMFEAALGHGPTSATLASMVESNLTESQLASAVVSSQTFANVNNGGVLLNPNAPASASLIDVLFINDLGHPPSVATLAGFDGMTNEQAFLAFATSATVTQALAGTVTDTLTAIVNLATGAPTIDYSLPEATIVGQAAEVHHLIG